MHHSAVLVHMAGMGKSAASQAASSLRSSYPEITLALVVGICGGVPSYSEGENDIILGDVVISDGIVSYDFGKQFPDSFSGKVGLERPDSMIRGVLAKLKGLRGRERIERKLSQHLKDLQDKLGSTRAGYPGRNKDELFQSTYRHKHRDPAACSFCTACEGSTDQVCQKARQLTCQQLGCQKEFLVPRKRLQEASTTKGLLLPPKHKVHFGLIGSGDTVMKSGEHRDEIATQHNLIAFEMEASGIWNQLSCFVVKGVCDYVDSHKNKYWQHYSSSLYESYIRGISGTMRINFAVLLTSVNQMVSSPTSVNFYVLIDR